VENVARIGKLKSTDQTSGGSRAAWRNDGVLKMEIAVKSAADTKLGSEMGCGRELGGDPPTGLQTRGRQAIAEAILRHKCNGSNKDAGFNSSVTRTGTR